MVKSTEVTLINNTRQGDKKAFQELYSNYRLYLLKAIKRIVVDPIDAEDLLQDTYIKVWQRFHMFDPSRGHLSTWLINVARNTALDWTRQRKFRHSSATLDLDAIALTYHYVPVIDSICVKYKVESVLSPQEWQLINLAYWQGYTQQEIAEQLDIPLGTVKTRIRKTLLNLRQHFDPLN